MPGSILQNMSNPSRIGAVTRSIMHLFSANKRNITFINHKDLYYKHYWLSKNLCDGIELVAAIERLSKKDAAEMLVKAGLSSYMGGKITEYIKKEQSARQYNQKVKPTRFVTTLRRFAREKGMDISKFI